MNTQSFARSAIGKQVVRLLAAAMESRFRYRFFGPMHILQGVADLEGRTVLEVGCGTGFFTIPAARLIGDRGSLVAMDVLAESVELVAEKVRASSLQQVQVVRGDALDTKLDGESFQTVILFGVIPAPMLPLTRLLPEMHRILEPRGILAVWPPVPGWLPQAIVKSRQFTLISKRNGVYNFRREYRRK
jgi:ubiquinone/menaquinone biosynthesis C-methylase UbiE